ncbi:MAG: hypothetical protein AMXMBFR13_44350 [Phycisphaerae bacterium]
MKKRKKNGVQGASECAIIPIRTRLNSPSLRTVRSHGTRYGPRFWAFGVMELDWSTERDEDIRSDPYRFSPTAARARAA